jgi:hypothetical protein
MDTDKFIIYQQPHPILLGSTFNPKHTLLHLWRGIPMKSRIRKLLRLVALVRL